MEKHGAFATKIASIYPQLCGLRCHTQFAIVTFQPHNVHQSNLRKNTVLKLPRNKILYL